MSYDFFSYLAETKQQPNITTIYIRLQRTQRQLFKLCLNWNFNTEFGIEP